MASTILCALVGLKAGISWNLARLINERVDSCYMDEIFHVPQAQLYCNGTFHIYHPKLTTPPGLYWFSYAKSQLEQTLSANLSHCSIFQLRQINLIFMLINFVIMFSIMKMRRHQVSSNSILRSNSEILVSASALSLLPPLYFFSFLYYTDQGSLLFILLTYWLSLRRRHWLASLSALVSLTFRQTNIVWIFYVAAQVAVQSLSLSTYESNTRKKLGIFKRLNWGTFIKDCFGYALVGATFIAFVMWNGGIVLGDRDAHQARVHALQFCYFLAFTLFFGWPWIVTVANINRFLYYCIRKPMPLLIALIIVVYGIGFHRYAHPYLLADNRHLTFYVWRRLLDRHGSLVPYAFSPVYLYSAYSVLGTFYRDRGVWQTLLYLLCTCASVIPNGLFELRYFIVAFVILRLEVNVRSLTAPILELITNLVINYLVLCLFVSKTFEWHDSPGQKQRIMW